MPDKPNEGAGAATSAVTGAELPESRVSQHGGWDFFQGKPPKTDRKSSPSPERQTHTPPDPSRWEGVTVLGEAVHRAVPASAGLLVELRSCAPTAAQAFHDTQTRTAHLARIFALTGVPIAELHTVSLDISVPPLPAVPALPPFAWSMAVPVPVYYARAVLRIVIREAGRAGEVIDAATQAGATVAASLTFQPADEAASRSAALEAAAKDARAKAEALAASAGRQLGEPIAISEDIVASNGTYTALRSAFPFGFVAGAPPAAGELEFFARVSARFRFR